MISGFVQGVFYRASARDAGHHFGLTGWVKNRYDGKVEAVAEGPRDRVQAFIEWCREGPPSARVTDVTVEWVDPANPGSPVGTDQAVKRVTVTVRQDGAVLAQQIALRSERYTAD